MKIRLILVLLASCFSCPLHADLANFGRFDGTPKVELLRDGRNIRLLEDFVYFDPDEKVWTAHKNFDSDGASIPQLFWSVVGGPLDGPYRDAAIIHDWYCKYKQRRWQDVHVAFYWASRARGVSELHAKVLYTAVALFGPRWNQKEWRWRKNFVQRFFSSTLAVNLTEEQLASAIDWIKSDDPSLDLIRFYVQDNYPVPMPW